MTEEMSKIGIALLDAANGFECSDKEWARRVGSNLVNTAASDARVGASESTQGLMMKYFVLKPRGDDVYAVASRRAIEAYAREIEDTNPIFAQELKMWVTREMVNRANNSRT